MTHEQRDVRKTARGLLADYKATLWPDALTYDDWSLSKIVGEIAGTIHRKAPRGYTEEPRNDVRAWMREHPLATRPASVV